MKKPTISIGIPAYNEEFNIKTLLAVTIRQKVRDADLTEIIVISDSSTDMTVQKAKSVEDPRIKIIENKRRSGQLNVQNEILRLAKGDILILLNADILPLGNNFIEEIIKPILHNKATGLVGADIISAKPETFIEKIISASHDFKLDIYKRINKCDNIYLCHGRARAFSKRFYSELLWPENYPEDAFSYLFCIKKGFKFVFAPKAKALFRSPTTLSDHIKQSTRFYGGKRKLEAYFSPDFVKKQYEIPKLIFGTSLIRYLFKKPLAIIGFLAISFYIRLFIKDNKVAQTQWDISESTKKVQYEKV